MNLCLHLFLISFSGCFCFCLLYSVIMCLFYFILFHYYSFDACLFSNERQNEDGSRREGREEEIGDVEGGETAIKI